MGFLSMANAGIVPVNAVFAGLIASFIGPQWTVGLAASALLAFSIWFVAAGKLSLVRAAGDESLAMPLPEIEPGLEVPGVPAAMAMIDEDS
jgi:hypothetical protein